MSTCTQVESNGLFELTTEARAELVSSKYYNEDLAPTSVSQRTWTTYNITMLWVGMSICIPSLSLSSALIGLGVSPWLSVLNVALGNILILIPIQLNSHAGTKYGIPFPAFSRLTFGATGAHLPSILRGLVACGWTSVQAWVGGGAVAALISIVVPKFGDATWTTNLPSWAGMQPAHIGQTIGFFLFMLFVLWVAYNGIEQIKWVQNIGGPLLIVIMIALLAWSMNEASSAGYSFGEVMNQPNDTALISQHGGIVLLFLSGLTGNIAFWATMALNIPDFSRYAHSQKAQFRGQLYGMPIPMAFCAFVGAFFAMATKLTRGEALFDPTAVFYSIDNGLAVFIAAIGVIAATITTCVAANVVAPANGFSNISPSRISYKKGVVITVIASLVFQPWWIYGSGAAYIFGWLNNYGIILAPVASIFIADYYICKSKRIEVGALYTGEKGRYWYSGGWNIAALIAWIVSFIFPLWANAEASDSRCKLILRQSWEPSVYGLQPSGYIFSFVVGFVLYVILMKAGMAKNSYLDEAEHEVCTRRA